MKSYSQALKILKRSKIKIGVEYINSSRSLNRICASNIYSNFDYPSLDNSSLDGYAVNSRDTINLSKKKIKKFEILESLAAGEKPITRKLKKFSTVEIMTGAIIPKCFDTVIPIENIIFFSNEKKSKYIIINKKLKKYSNVRFKGSDFKKGQIIIKKGDIIRSNHILAFKTLGLKEIKVKKKLNILFFSTGKEISNNNKIPDWKLRDSNSEYIGSLKENFSFSFKKGKILRDNHEKNFELEIKKMLKSKTDIIITSGGVSVGKFDYIPKVINKFKLLSYFKNILIRPGKPILFAKIKKKVIFGLPGNPISTAACFRFFVYPFIEFILGIKKEQPIKASLKNNFVKKKKFTRFIKSKLSTTSNGKIEVELLSGQESFRINPFVSSNAWALLPNGKKKFKKGQIIDCFLMNSTNKILF